MLKDCNGCHIRNFEENPWKIQTMKNFKTHKKLCPFKCQNFYRTNCNLVMGCCYAFVMLITITSCSEISLRHNTTFHRDSNPVLPYAAISEVTSYLSTYKSDNNSRISRTGQQENSARLIAVTNSTPLSSQQLVGRLEATNSSKKRKSKPPNFHRIQKIVMQGLGLQSVPDVAKMNVSQQEYLAKYREYLDLVKKRQRREVGEYHFGNMISGDIWAPTIMTITQNVTETRQYSRRRRRRSTFPDNVVYMRFPLKVDAKILSSSDAQNDVDEANLRLLLVTKQGHGGGGNGNNFRRGDGDRAILTLKVYQLIEPYGRIWLDSKEVEVGSKNISTIFGASSRWLEFDVTKAVKGWISGRQANLGLEIHCDNCHSHGSHIVEDLSINTDPDSNPVLNIIGTYGTHREKRSRQHHHFMQNGRRKPRKTDCYKENQKCCRHTMEVVFKEIKGFEFIIQPKVFDAGYCRGKCPPRYNPAHHHAFLQSLIWKQDRSKAPRPCCAPSKLVELEVLHVDENDNKKLKVSTWSDMRVLECACS